MNAFARIDPDAFFRFAAEHAEQRFELDEGRIVQQMIGGTRRHAIVARRMSVQIEAQLDPAKWTVLQDRGVKVGDAVGSSARYPDVVVEPSAEPGGSLSTSAPALIVVVLSPSSTAIDLNTKPSEYLSIPTLDVDIVASQDEPALLVFERGRDGTFPSEAREVSGNDNRLAVHGRHFTIEFDVAAVSKGIA